MTRRDAIKQVTFLMGGVLSASAITGLLQGCQPKTSGTNWQPEIFTADQIDFLAEFAERIMPKTDTPGAKDALVHQLIDALVAQCYPKEEQNAFITGLDSFAAACKKETGSNFVALDDEEKDVYLTEQAMAAQLARKNGKRPFFLSAKGLVLGTFFSTEIGATQVLQYKLAPGEWKACIPAVEVERAWLLD